eukprot:c28422_g2_i1 orf=702-1481(-)
MIFKEMEITQGMRPEKREKDSCFSRQSNEASVALLQPLFQLLRPQWNSFTGCLHQRGLDFPGTVFFPFRGRSNLGNILGYCVDISNFLEGVRMGRKKRQDGGNGVWSVFGQHGRNSVVGSVLNRDWNSAEVSGSGGTTRDVVRDVDELALTDFEQNTKARGTVGTHSSVRKSVQEENVHIHLTRKMESASGAGSKEELGRATWTLLHTIAAQFPARPTRQQQCDVKELMAILSRIYPCKQCADHFKEVLKSHSNFVTLL